MLSVSCTNPWVYCHHRNSNVLIRPCTWIYICDFCGCATVRAAVTENYSCWWMYNWWGFSIPHSKIFKWQHDFCRTECFNPWSRLTLMSPDPWGWQLKCSNILQSRGSEETRRCWQWEKKVEGKHTVLQEFLQRTDNAKAGSARIWKRDSSSTIIISSDTWKYFLALQSELKRNQP